MIASRPRPRTKPLTLALVAATLIAVLTACERPRRGPFPFTLEADDARGLQKGASVTVAGVEVGKVRAVTLAGRKARIDLALATPDLLTEGTCATIAAYGMTGPMHVELDPPEGKRPLPDGQLITCVRAAGDHDRQLHQIFRSIGAILDLAVTGKGVIGRLLRDEKLADQMERWLAGAGGSSTTPSAVAEGTPAEPPPPAAGARSALVIPKMAPPPPLPPVPAAPLPAQPKWKAPGKVPSKPKIIVPF